MTAVLEFLWTFLAILLIVLVLLHSPKGDGLAAIGGQGELFSSPKSAEENLNRVTWLVLTGFLVLSVLLGSGWLTSSVG
ncbi:MAG: preprotein translocase subunit SecG [Cyanobacteria bacterium J06642_2]